MDSEDEFFNVVEYCSGEFKKISVLCRVNTQLNQSLSAGHFRPENTLHCLAPWLSSGRGVGGGGNKTSTKRDVQHKIRFG